MKNHLLTTRNFLKYIFDIELKRKKLFVLSWAVISKNQKKKFGFVDFPHGENFWGKFSIKILQ